jgi:hypothetical protein
MIKFHYFIVSGEFFIFFFSNIKINQCLFTYRATQQSTNGPYRSHSCCNSEIFVRAPKFPIKTRKPPKDNVQNRNSIEEIKFPTLFCIINRLSHI